MVLTVFGLKIAFKVAFKTTKKQNGCVQYCFKVGFGLHCLVVNFFKVIVLSKSLVFYGISTFRLG